MLDGYQIKATGRYQEKIQCGETQPDGKHETAPDLWDAGCAERRKIKTLVVLDTGVLRHWVCKTPLCRYAEASCAWVIMMKKIAQVKICQRAIAMEETTAIYDVYDDVYDDEENNYETKTRIGAIT